MYVYQLSSRPVIKIHSVTIIRVMIDTKACKKKLADRIEYERCKRYNRVLRQLMIPLSITIFAVLLIHYDKSLVRYFD